MSTATQPAPPRPYRTPRAVRRALFVLAGIAGVVMVACAASSLIDLAARHTTTERSTHTDIRALRIEGSSDVRITGAPAGAPVSVVAEITEGLRSPRRRVERQPDGTLRLSSSCQVLFGGSCDVDYDIAVPAGTRVRIDAGAGDVDLEQLASGTPVQIRTSAGDISAVGLDVPELELRASAGDVEAHDVSARVVRVRTSAGDVALSLDDPLVRLEVDASAGDVDIEVPDRAYRLDVDSTAGDVDTSTVRNDPDARRTIEAHASAGDITIGARR